MRIISVLFLGILVSACSLRGYIQPTTQQELHLSPYASATFQRCVEHSSQRFCPNGENCNSIVKMCVERAESMARNARVTFNQNFANAMNENCNGDVLCSLQYQKQVYDDMFEVSIAETFSAN